MARVIVLAMTVAFAGWASMAVAQAPVVVAPPPPNLQPMSRGESPYPMDRGPLGPMAARESQAALDRYADCLVGKVRLRPALTSFTRAIPGSAAMNELAKSTMDSACATKAVSGGASVQLNIRQDTMRQALFGALYRREFGAASPVIPAEPAALSLAAEFDGSIAELSPEFRGYRALGDCIVRADPAGSRAWVMAPFNTPAAKAAQGPVVQALGGCLTAAQTVAIAPFTLRGIVAEALYRLTAANAVEKKAE